MNDADRYEATLGLTVCDCGECPECDPITTPAVAALPTRRPTLLDCPVCASGLMTPGSFACESCMSQVEADMAHADFVRARRLIEELETVAV